MPCRQADADGVADALHQFRPEGVARSHLQEEEHPLLPVLVVLGDTEAVHHLLEGLHCRDGKGPQSRTRPPWPVRREGEAGHPSLMGTATSPPPSWEEPLRANKQKNAHHWQGSEL